mgnify:CR=1 FL=1
MRKNCSKGDERQVGDGKNRTEYKLLFFSPAVTHGKGEVKQKTAESGKGDCKKDQGKSCVEGGVCAKNNVAPAKSTASQKPSQQIEDCCAYGRHQRISQTKDFE